MARVVVLLLAAISRRYSNPAGNTSKKSRRRRFMCYRVLLNILPEPMPRSALWQARAVSARIVSVGF